MNRSRRTAGTSLVEILVVIVVFLIGILAIVQIFPGGFRLLGLTRSQSQATQLVRTYIEQMKSRADQLPDRVVPVRYVRANGELVAIVDSNRRTNDLGPTADGLTTAGFLSYLGDNLGPWRRASGANMVNRIVGEGSIVPAPRPVANAINDPAYYGGLLNLQFGPAVFNPEVAGNSTDNDVVFSVYANDLSLALGPPPDPLTNPFRDYLYYCDAPEQPGATIYVPQSATPIRYRFAATAYVRDAANVVRTVELLDYILTIPAGAPQTYYAVPMSAVFSAPIINPGDTFLGVAFDSLQLAPIFERIPKGTNFGAGNPYEYKLLDDLNAGLSNANMGVLLFNPAGHNYYVPNSDGRRIPLTVRVNYNVYDWGILRNEVRIPSALAEAVRLPLGSLKVKGNSDTDGLPYQGLGFVVSNGAGGTQELDVVVQDAETGGIYSPDSYVIDKSIGTIRFIDGNTGTPEIDVTIFNSANWTPAVINDAGGRTVRVYYQSSQEYQVQVLKAASRYIGVSGVPGSGQVAIGNPLDPIQRTRLYFANSELGRGVAIHEAFVQGDFDGTGPLGVEVRKVSVSGTIKSPAPSDPVGLPYFDLVDVYGPSVIGWSTVDENGKNPGYIVRGVRGSSVAVRVLWNPAKFSLTGTDTQNMAAFDKWGANWRKSTTETYLQKGGTQ